LYNINAIQELMGIASLIKKMLGKTTPVIDSTYGINKTVLCSGNSDVDHVSDEVLNSADIQIKISVNSIYAYCKVAFSSGISSHI
jgi:hypothetical protein